MRVQYDDRSMTEPSHDLYKVNNRTRYIFTCTGLKCITRFLDAWSISESAPVHRSCADTLSDKCAADLDPRRRRWTLQDVWPK